MHESAELADVKSGVKVLSPDEPITYVVDCYRGELIVSELSAQLSLSSRSNSKTTSCYPLARGSFKVILTLYILLGFQNEEFTVDLVAKIVSLPISVFAVFSPSTNDETKGYFVLSAA